MGPSHERGRHAQGGLAPVIPSATGGFSGNEGRTSVFVLRKMKTSDELQRQHQERSYVFTASIPVRTTDRYVCSDLNGADRKWHGSRRRKGRELRRRCGSKDRKSTRLNSSHLGISYAVF